MFRRTEGFRTGTGGKKVILPMTQKKTALVMNVFFILNSLGSYHSSIH